MLMMSNVETAKRFKRPRTRRHFGWPSESSPLKKRVHANPRRKGGENMQNTLTMLNSHKPRIVIRMLGRLFNIRKKETKARRRRPLQKGKGEAVLRPFQKR
jgi:hypothetical protein